MKEHGSARVTQVSESDAIAVAGGLYQPIRRALDVRAFGVNAYFAPLAGNQLIERHDERGLGAGGHVELYVVLSGRATFRVDGEEIDAPAGTIVFLPDPASTREATATEDGTSALVVGGPADRELPVSPFEYWFTAERPYNAGDYDQAIAIVSAGLQEWPEHPTMLYQLACYHALAGHREQALDHFERACAGSPKPKEWQEGDTDLDSIRDDPRFAAARV
jgi:tetratricopeptide (TPR) repeat protein